MIKRIYTDKERDYIRELYKNGMKKCDISRKTGICAENIANWIKYPDKDFNRIKNYKSIENFEEYLNTEEKQKAYSFILAVYLCDGYICTNIKKRFNGAPVIHFYNDSRYIKNTKEWADNLQILIPLSTIRIKKRKNSNCFIVKADSHYLIDLFPQHGTGKKHDRKLELADWQKKIVEKYPHEFIRGCIQSDGCIWFQKNDNRKRYEFTNVSEDIANFFLDALKLIGIEAKKYWAKAGFYQVKSLRKAQEEILSKIITCKE